jgi:hypothetical protein
VKSSHVLPFLAARPTASTWHNKRGKKAIVPTMDT